MFSYLYHVLYYMQKIVGSRTSNFKPQCNQTKYFKSVFAGSLLSMQH